MKKYLIIALAMTTLISCDSNTDMSLFKENKEIAKNILLRMNRQQTTKILFL